VAYNVKCRTITGSHVTCKSGNMSEIVQDRDVTTDH